MVYLRLDSKAWSRQSKGLNLKRNSIFREDQPNFNKLLSIHKSSSFTQRLLKITRLVSQSRRSSKPAVESRVCNLYFRPDSFIHYSELVIIFEDKDTDWQRAKQRSWFEKWAPASLAQTSIITLTLLSLTWSICQVQASFCNPSWISFQGI